MKKNTGNNFSDNSWQIPKKVKEKSKKWKIFGLVFLWGFLFFFILVFADYYFFYQENKKYFSDQKAGFELILENLKNNLEQKNFSKLEKNIGILNKKISKDYSEINKKISERKFLIGSKKILNEGKKFSDNGISLTENFLEMKKNFEKISDKNFKGNPIEKILKLNSENLEKIQNIEKFLSFLENKILILPGFQSSQKLQISDFLNKIILLKNISEEIDKNKEFISEIFGKKSPQTSVIFFQNSNESRVTGGFVGSFLIFTTNNGKILNWKIHDIYDFDGQLKGNFEKVPFEAKSLVGNKNWSLRDFNENPNLEISSKNFNYFFEKAGGRTVDSFFYLDAKILSEILKIIGPIKLKHLEISVDSNNWDFVFQYFVESKKHFFISPKKLLIGEVFLGLKEKMKNSVILGLDPGIQAKQNGKNKTTQQDGFPPSREGQRLEQFFNLKNKILQKKYLKFYSNNSEINNLFQKNIFQKKDEIEKYFISISSNKSDKFVENKFKIRKDNSSEKIISLKRKFFKSEKEKSDFEEYFEFLFKKFGSDIPKNDLKKILGFGKNNSILQFYTDKNLDLLFVKKGKEDLKFKKWKQGEKNVFEVKLPILKMGEKQEIFFNFKKK